MYHIDIEADVLPKRFNDPFCYLPHPLCVKAADAVQARLQYPENKDGKMFGVMIVCDEAGRVGYITACSGNEQASGAIDFVPQIFELLNPDDYFVAEEREISAINRKIDELLTAGDYLRLKEAVATAREDSQRQMDVARQTAATAKAERDRRRNSEIITPELEVALVRESQFQKAELKRLQRSLQQRLEELERQLQAFDTHIENLKIERKQRSVALQRRLFDSYRVLNARGEERSLYKIFKEHTGALPPSGAGECAAPKLLQYAYKHGLQPFAMAEFWLGRSTTGECRRHGWFYPACESKCRPLLSFMLQGLEVETTEYGALSSLPLKTIFEDDYIIVADKPAGMLSVPGKGDRASVYSHLQQQYGENLYVVHRLDMDTSGLLLLAKTRDVYKKMQRAFATHSVRKVYEAIVDGVPASEVGVITLPLCLNPDDRPRQMVNYEYGKAAVTQYRVIDCFVPRNDAYSVEKTIALVEFIPLTGRTHQLRVHAAHRDGLNVPILGDRLYGRPASRLFLHARQLTFRHPITNVETTVISPQSFNPSILQSLNPSIPQSLNPSIPQSLNPSILQSFNPSIPQSLNPSIKLNEFFIKTFQNKK